jgi:hypothetical protein
MNGWVSLVYWVPYCNTKKKLERGSRVDQKFDFLNRCSDGRSETADAKITEHDAELLQTHMRAQIELLARQMKPTPDIASGAGLNSIAHCSTSSTMRWIRSFSSGFIRSVHFCTKKMPKWTTSRGLSGKVFWILLETFQDIDFEDLDQQQAEEPAKCH